MVNSTRSKAYLQTDQGKQLTFKRRLGDRGKILTVKSAHILYQHEVTLCERGNEVAFIFKDDQKYYTPEFQADGKPLKLLEFTSEPNDDKLQFLKWANETGLYYRLTYTKVTQDEKFLCCDTNDGVFLGPTNEEKVYSYRFMRTNVSPSQS